MDLFNLQEWENIVQLTPREIMDSLTVENVLEIMGTLDVYPLRQNEDYIIFPTCCHNHKHDEASGKLYYYVESKIFYCYTQCSKSYNILKLIEQYMIINNIEMDFQQRLNFIQNATTFELINLSSRAAPKLIWRPHNYNFLLPEKSKNILNTFYNHYPLVWQNEGISDWAMERFGIKFDVSGNKIIIPNYDHKQRLIGIRVRNLDEEKMQVMKYGPLFEQGQSYSFPASLALYGFWVVKQAIKKHKYAIVVEGEKSTLKGYSFYLNNSCVVATLGSSLSFHQVQLLVRECGVNEIIVAYDKEYQRWGTQEQINYRIKLTKMVEPYLSWTNFSIIMDKDNLLQYKDSPIDRGREVFEELLEKRIRIEEKGF